MAVLVNESAGAARGQDAGAFADGLASAFARRGASADVALLPGDRIEEAAQRARDSALRGEVDAVAVGGGDGTVGTVAGVLAGTGIALGVLPLGTLNHFAKDLGIPLDLEEAVAAICRGQARTVDVGEVNGQVFINNSSIGLYPYMVLDRERRTSRTGQAKWIAGIWAGLRTLRYLPLRRLAIRTEGWSEPCRTPCVFVGNNEYCLVGSSLGRRERLDEGELFLYVARQQSRAGLLWLALRSALGLVDEGRDLRVVKVASAEIASRTSRLLVAKDGEVSILRSPLHYRIRPGALRIFAPDRPRA